VLHTLTAQESWRGLEGYVPVVANAIIPSGGGKVVVNYTGRGILMSTNWATSASPVATKIIIDGVTIADTALPNTMTLLISFKTSLYVYMVSGGAGGPGAAVYLKET